MLTHQGLITLERVMHDGTKIKAAASDRSFHRQGTLKDHLKEAEEQLQAMGYLTRKNLVNARLKPNSERCARSNSGLKRRSRSWSSLSTIAPRKKPKKKKKQPRASSTDPQARVMLGAKGAYAPSYNVQISTDANAKIIVGVDVNQSCSDAGQLEPAVERIEANLGQKPEQMVVDGAYPTQQAIEAMADKGIDLIGPLPQQKKALVGRVEAERSQWGILSAGLLL